MAEDDAYIRGWTDYEHGKGPKDCPYPGESQEYLDWHKGFLEADIIESGDYQ